MSETPRTESSPRDILPGGGRAAWVAFSGRSAVWWTRFLSPGFRHCLVVVDLGLRWLVVDPLTTRMEVRRIDRSTVPDLPARLSALGLVVVSVHARPARRSPKRRPRTCVEAVKRVLGMNAPLTLTPRQLFRRLVREAGSVPLPPFEALR